MVKTNSNIFGSGVGEFTINATNGIITTDGNPGSPRTPTQIKINENMEFSIQYNDMVDTCNLKISNAREYVSGDTLNPASPIRYSYRIASLKGQTPVIAISNNPPIGDTQNITAQIITEATYPNLYLPYSISTGWKNIPAEYYEWTLPANWHAAGQSGTTFVLSAAQKSITITPDYVTAGEIKIRALNYLRTAGSETKSNALNRGFSFTQYPTSITFGDNTAKTFSTTLFSGITYEWKVPSGWQINGQGSTLQGLNLNSVSITPSFCSLDGKVQVRLIKGDDVSTWYEFKNYQGISKPSITASNSTIYQLEDADFTINNINMAGVQTINCTDSRVYFSGYQGSNFKISFLQTGTYTVNISLLMIGCSTPILVPITITVLPNRIQLSGPSYACPSSNATFTVNNATSGYTWGCSSNLTPINGSPGSFTTSFIGGDAWVSINVHGKEGKRMNFIIGSQITGVDQIVYIQTNRYYADPACSDQNNIWILSWQGMNTLTEKPDTVYGKNYIDVVSTASPNNMTIYDLSLIQNNGYRPIKYISVRGVKLGLVGIKKPNPFPPIELLLYPNPTTNLLNLEIKTDDIDISNFSQNNTSKKDNDSYTIQLWSEYQGLIRTMEITEKKHQISLQELPAGMYFVLVIKDDKVLQRKIMLKK
jgi:hypothetical protein